MDNEPAVRMRDGARHLEEQVQPRHQWQPPLPHVVVDRASRDIFQGEVRRPLLVMPASYRLAIFGCSRAARISRSSAIHSASFVLPHAHRGSLRATGRFTITSVRYASQTVPIPPSESLRSIR